MQFDANTHKCTIVIDEALPTGLAINAASVISVNFGKHLDNLVGHDLNSQDGVNYPGVIYAPLPILKTSGQRLLEILKSAESDPDIVAYPFSSLAQSCKTYEEYESRISSVPSENIELVAVGLFGAKKRVNRLTGNLALFK